MSDTNWDDPINPQQLRVSLGDGIADQSRGRFDVRWTTEGYYSFHYSQPGLGFRFDYHPKPGVPDAHFHPHGGGTALASCIAVESPELVARAIRKCWREAYESGDPSQANALSEPP